MNFFNKNIAVLKAVNPSLANVITAANNDNSIEAVKAKTGDAVPRVAAGDKRLFVHSRFDPITEAERFTAEAGPQDLYLVFGFGFGFHVEALLKKAPADSLVIVLEKNPAMLRAAFAARDLSQMLSAQNLIILAKPDDESILAALKGRASSNVSLLLHRGSHQIDGEYYSSLMEMCRSWLSTKEVNIATLAKFEKLWSSNIARNIGSFIGLPPAEAFYEKFTGLPAIIAGAGPSLTESLDFIKANQRRAAVIAVDTAMKILLKAGITPHFCLAADPQIVNARYFEGLPESETVLVADPTVHPSVFHLYKGPAAVTSIAFDLMKWIEDICGKKGSLTHGGSVSTNAFDLARRLGCSPIILIGQDLAFTGGRAHVRGSYIEEQVFLRNGRLFNQEMYNRSQISALPKLRMPGIRSASVITNQKMMIFMGWFQKQKCDFLINATSDGMFLSGIRHVPMKDIALADIDVSLHEKIFSVLNGWQPPLCAERKIADRVRTMLSETEELIPVFLRAEELAGELAELVKSGKGNSGKIEYILQKLDAADRAAESAEAVKGMLSLVSQRAIHTISEGYDRTSDLSPEETAARRSQYLYKEFKENCLFLKKALNTMLKGLSKIS